MSLPRDILNRSLAFLGRPAARFAYGDALASRNDHWAAFPQFARAARAGLRQAQFRLGECYLVGLGVPASSQEAIRWLTKAAEAGETAAQTQLASLALQGITDRNANGLSALAPAHGTAPDYHRAEHWSRTAAAAGSAEAKALLAFILIAGPDDLRDHVAGDACYRESADAGWSRGQLGRAMILLCEGTLAAAVEAQTLLRAAAKADVAVAYFLVGAVAESGAAGLVDFPAALAAYKAAAELGHAPGQLRYGLALLAGRGGPTDEFTAETWLRRAALAGQVHAAAAIGDLYVREGDLPPNHAEAALWFHRAAEAGHAGSARMLGRFHLHGTGVRRDIQEAVHWLRLAIERGDDHARADMAQLALTGQVGEADQRDTAVWFGRLAETGIPAAQFNLGLCLAQGIGVERDDAAALAWFDAAAEAVPAARFWSDRMLAEGRGLLAASA
ncbi:tetratricopeptide repeat protein [Rhodopila sp.]|uniref:tetratricopeptide repeat protein n=1 Tax=Rhodopila sp. TaxID=2480087 RepID=UPI003D115696